MAKRNLLKILALGLMVASALAPSSGTVAQSAQQTTAFTISPVVKRGDPRMDGGTFFDFDFCDVRIAGEHGLNDLGQVVISGFVGNCTTGVYVVSDRTGFLVADTCHPTPFGRLALYAGANINNRGHVALNMGPAVNNTIVDMILLYSDGRLSKIVADGDQSPRGPIFGDCGFSAPIINNKSEVAFSGCSKEGALGRNGIFVYADGILRQVLQGGDSSPLGGVLSLNLFPSQPVFINDGGDILFRAGQLDPDITVPERFGLFLATAEGIKRVELSKDPMPNGSTAADNSIGRGTLNNNGAVAFGLRLSGKPKAGGFVWSGGQTSTIILDRGPAPTGGTFDLRSEVEDIGGPRINNNGTIAFMANVIGGSSPEAIFLASPKAIVKVVGIGDRLPTGEKIRSINSFSLNNLGQVAFFANGSASILNPNPLGVYLATPVAPSISSIKLKHKPAGLQVRVNGSAMIPGDTVIEINGVPVGAIDYPADSKQDGGFTTQVISRDPQLEQLMAEGQTVQVTVFNSLTNLRSAPFSLTR